MGLKRSLAVLAGALVCLAGLSPQTARSAEPTHITVAPMTPSAVAWIAYFIAQPLGYYTAENLDVDVIRNPPRGSQVSGLLSGQITFGGLSSVNNMPVGPAKDKLEWFVVHENFPFSVFVLDKSPIKSVKDLGGKTVAMRSANDEPVVKLLMAGGDHLPGSYKTLVAGPGMPGGVALQRGSADALVGTAVDQMEITGGGVALRKLDLGGAAGLYNGGVMARVDTLSDKRDAAVRFGRALAKAYVWVYENPDAALALLAKVVPEAMQNPEVAKKILLALNDLNRERYEARFKADPAVFQRQIDLLTKIGQIKEPLKPEAIFTNDLLPEIWNFDVDALKAEARRGRN
jgi:NitT/TauT family transport system substrate-binding protein